MATRTLNPRRLKPVRPKRPAWKEAKKYGPPVRPRAPLPLRPPPGTYDPALDAQERATGRGLQDLESDALRAGTRSDVDYGIAQGDITRQRDEGLTDLNRDFWRSQQGFDWQRTDTQTGSQRGLADLMTARGRGEQDYGRATADLGRGYKALGARQQGLARAMGVSDVGSLEQQSRIRAANQARDQGVLDTNNQRFMGDNSLAAGRLTEDTATDLSRLDTRQGWLGADTRTAAERMVGAHDRGQGALSLAFTRGGQDRQTTLDRARRENTQFGLDIGNQRWYQSKGLYTPPRGTEVGGWGRPRRKKR